MHKAIILFPLILFNVALASLNVQSPEKRSSDSVSISDANLVAEVAPLVQHFACISYQLVQKTVRNKSTNEFLYASEKWIVDFVEQTYAQEVEKARSLLFNPDLSEQKKALSTFGNYILQLCSKGGIRKNYIQSFPQKLSNSATMQEHYTLVKQAINVLEKKFESIKPVSPLSTRIANVLFYNVVSTKIAPKVVSYGIGPVLALLWAKKKCAAYSEKVRLHPHCHAFKRYDKIDHDTEVTCKGEPSYLQNFFNITMQTGQKVTPCEERWGEHICNGDKDLNKMREVSRPLSGLPFGLFHAQENSMQEKVEWAKGCTEACTSCYHYRGYKSPERIIALLVRKSVPIAGIILGCRMLASAMEDAQIHEYEQRKKDQQKKEQEKKIAAEMKRLKVNYEKSIEFDTIKGQSDLIDKEGRLLVDYLKNPLRYKNNTGTRSVLFYGPPGTGKTLMARAIAKESGAPFLEITADDILDDRGKDKITATLKLAEDVAVKRPEKSAIIYIDEIDCVTGNRQNGTLDPQRAKALSNLLSIFDGIEKRNPFIHILIVITTNHYKNLDPALLRPGRIDRKILITAPNASGRGEFFESLLTEKDKEFKPWLIEQTEGFNGAQIVNVVDTAHMIAAYAGRQHPSKADYESALQNCKQENSDVPEEARVV